MYFYGKIFYLYQSYINQFTMASLKLLLGMIPSTLKIEQAEKALIAEFEKLHAFSESDQLANYNETGPTGKFF